MKRIALTPTLAVLAAVAAGCGGVDQAADGRPEAGPVSAKAESATHSALASPTPTDSTATTAQFASITAKHGGAWEEQVATVEENCLDPETIPACYAGYATLGIMAETLELEFTAAHDSTSGGYIGQVPSEVRQLVSDTESAASAVEPAFDAFDAAGCTDPLDMACAGEAMTLRRAVDDLSAQFDAWMPYGG